MASSGSTGKQTQEPGAPPVYLMSMALNQDHSGLCVATTKDFRTFFLYSQAQQDNFVEFRRRLMSAPVAVAVMLYKTNIRAIVSAAEPTRVLLWDDKTGTAPHALCSRPEVLSVQMRRDVIAVVTEYKIYVYSLPELDVMLHLDTHGNSRGVCTLNCDVHRETVMCCPDQQRGGIRSIATGDDDQYLVSSSSSNTVHVFRLASARHRRSGSGSQGMLTTKQYRPANPTRFAAASDVRADATRRLATTFKTSV
ncbi:WD repeat domain phosphoinositide-interacting protein, putative [Perkinsus marinus ATCC 50983]|uniref:WD repeat domain phosphoinositide-interacting protein, putative n=1 Tax=Perkinsus marinus (strain ATCC 50983 / TXsc) TaxID=423536 RepID=C5LY31_PERM5|nr:WD repeat domain phosphoinositide-interacting protein, putative [Perkinsus marinus ATCC 50983]EEQ98361.1 WD repeat domain phosphoinositide-interacting protein, putative [Perkinsus marinus ATCC 50983]|eukprot:XP_002765644.1 WD repeat domain phosphoinositide-interacting protein, putative [Perkinsus marinus ATCC 50983]